MIRNDDGFLYQKVLKKINFVVKFYRYNDLSGISCFNRVM